MVVADAGGECEVRRNLPVELHERLQRGECLSELAIHPGNQRLRIPLWVQSATQREVHFSELAQVVLAIHPETGLEVAEGQVVPGFEGVAPGAVIVYQELAGYVVRSVARAIGRLPVGILAVGAV